METLTILLIVIITALILIMICVLLVWILYDINRIKRFHRLQQPTTINNNHHQNHHYLHNKSDFNRSYSYQTLPDLILCESNIDEMSSSKASFKSYLDDKKVYQMSNIDSNNNSKNQQQTENQTETKITIENPQTSTTNKLGSFLKKFHHNDHSTTAIKKARTFQKHRPIRIDRFPFVFQWKSRDSDLLFSKEFNQLEKLCREDVYKRLPLALNDGTKKDRFHNVLPFKHSLVKLDPLPDESNSHYINASFIPGYVEGEHEYIATMAPWKSDIVDDFFRMILQYEIEIVVNLLEYEPIRYFPKWLTDEPMKRTINGQCILVKLVKHVQESDDRPFHLRLVQFCKLSDDNDEQTILHETYQFHYTQWKDFSCPEQEESLLKLIEAVRYYKARHAKFKSSPILVHCRAGIGRTGTFIAIDNLWQRLHKEFLTAEFPRRKFWQETWQNDNQSLHSDIEQPPTTEIPHHTENVHHQTKSFRFEAISKIFSKNLKTIEHPQLDRHGKRKDINIENEAFKTAPSRSASNESTASLSSNSSSLSATSLISSYVIDVFNLVYLMRSYRMGMVQTESQYVYIHKCLKYILEHWRMIRTDEIKELMLDEPDRSSSSHTPDNDNVRQQQTTTTSNGENEGLQHQTPTTDEAITMDVDKQHEPAIA